MGTVLPEEPLLLVQDRARVRLARLLYGRCRYSNMASISPLPGRPVQDQKVAWGLPPHPPGPPTSWRLSEIGEPEWLREHPYARHGGWVVIAPLLGTELRPDVRLLRERDAQRTGGPTWDDLCADTSCRRIAELGPAMFPALTWLSQRPQGLGRPKRQYGRFTRNTARGAAWLRDVHGWSITKIAREITSSVEVFDDLPDTRAARRDASGYVRAGRLALADEGVLPWACWDDEEDGRGLAEGDVPEEWWWDEWFLTHVHLWGKHAADVAEAASRNRFT